MTRALSKIAGDKLKLSEIDYFAIGVSRNHCCNPSLPKKWSLSSSFWPPVYYKSVFQSFNPKLPNWSVKLSSYLPFLGFIILWIEPGQIKLKIKFKPKPTKIGYAGLMPGLNHVPPELWGKKLTTCSQSQPSKLNLFFRCKHWKVHLRCDHSSDLALKNVSFFSPFC